MSLHDKTAHAKHLSPLLGGLDASLRNKALGHIIKELQDHREDIFRANRIDLDRSRAENLDPPLLKRLAFDEAKLAEMVLTYESLMGLPDPLGRLLEARELSPGLELYRSTCPIGVIAMIFESRPDALVQIAGLCLKSGNAVILKGGKEALETNRVLSRIIHDAACACGYPSGWMVNLESREEVTELLAYHQYVDLVIPRGSNTFVQHIMATSRIPVMGHADGICHVFVDEDAEESMAVSVATDSKTHYVAVCNAAETLLVHARVAHKLLPPLARSLINKKVELHCCTESLAILREVGLDGQENLVQDWSMEWLDYKMSVRIVGDLDGAITHINRYGSHHTDAIITSNKENAEKFMRLVDSASVFWNASTRFADGFRYGLGAEVGISTGKLHARGPVGMEGLLTYKWKLFGSGQTVADFSGPEGKKYTHRNLTIQ